MGRPKKKVILFVVEGHSDRATLERPIKAMLEDNPLEIEAEFLVADTDITSDRRHNPDNILQKINHFYFEPFFSANDYYYPKDILEVVQICDLDGTYVADDHCRQYTDRLWSESGFIYEPPFIYGATEAAVIDRNHRKAANIDFLLNLDSIKVKTKTVPYSLLFFSINIEHFLYHKLNVPTREKINLGESFADRYCNSPRDFYKRMISDEGSIMNCTVEESWNFIRSNGHSLEPFTNLGIFLKSLADQIGLE